MLRRAFTSIALFASTSWVLAQDQAAGLQDRFRAAFRAMTEGRYAGEHPVKHQWIITLLLAFVLAARADAQDSTDARARYQSAYRAAATGRYDEAIELFEKLVDDPELPDDVRGNCAYNLTCVYSLKGDVESALRSFERTLELVPTMRAEQFRADPDLANLRADPRFDRAMQALPHRSDREHEGRLERAKAARATLERRDPRSRSSPLAWLDGGSGVVVRVRLSPDGRRAVTWNTDESAWLWDAWTGEPLGLLGFYGSGTELGAVDMFPRLEFSSDGERILLFDPQAGVAGLWDGRSAEFLGYLEVGTQVLRAAVFRPDGRRVATADESGAVRFFHADSGRPLDAPHLEADQVNELAYSPDGSRLLALSALQRARLWDAESGRLLGEIGSAELPLTSGCFSADGTRILGVGPGPTALVYELGDPREVLGEPKVLRDPNGSWSSVDWGAGGGGTAWRTSLMPTVPVPPTGERLVVSLRDGTARLWDPRSGVEVAALTGVSGGVPGMEFSWPWLCFSPDGTRLVTLSGGEGHLWNADTGERVADLAGGTLPFFAEYGAFSPSGRHFASTATEPKLGPIVTRLYDGVTGEFLGQTEPTSGTVAALHFAHDERLGVASANGCAYVWDGGPEPVSLQPHAVPVADQALHAGSRRWSPDGSSLVSFGYGSREVRARVWDARTGGTSREVARTSLPLGVSADFLESGELLLLMGVSGGRIGRRLEVQDALEGEVSRFLDLPAGNPLPDQLIASWTSSRLLLRDLNLAALHDLADGRRLATLRLVELPLATTEYSPLHLVALSPDGRLAAAAESAGVRLWDATGGAELELLPGTVRDLEFSPDGSWLAGASLDGTVLVFDVEARRLLRSLPGDGPGSVRFIAVAPDSRHVVAAAEDGRARIWDVRGEEDPRVLAGHEGPLNRPAFSRDGTRLLTPSQDGTARLWNVATGAELAVLEGHLGAVMRGEFSPDGSRVLTLAMDASTRIWDAATGRLLATRVEYDDGWLTFEPGGHYIAGGSGAERARMVVNGRRFPLSSYAAIYESPERVADSLAGKPVRAPSFVPQAPEVRVAAPLDPLVPERRFQLEVLIEDVYGIESVHIEEDGRELDAKWVAEHLKSTGKSSRLSCELALPEGVNQTTVEVRATNVREIRSAPQTVSVRWQPPQRELYVLAMGVADYDDDQLDLAYPTKDADDLIARFAKEEGGYYKKVKVTRLVNAEVTPGRLRKAREEFLLSAQPDDTIVVFAAGHGVRSESGEYYFLTPGTTPESPYDGIERQVLESLVTWDKLHAKRRILLLDTCHSGEAFGEGKRGVALDAFDQKTVNEAAGTGLYIIAASSNQGFAQELEGNGLFTRCVLEGLDGAADANKDGLVGIDELKGWTTSAVHERSAGRQRPTAPKIEGGEDFPIARSR